VPSCAGAPTRRTSHRAGRSQPVQRGPSRAGYFRRVGAVDPGLETRCLRLRFVQAIEKLVLGDRVGHRELASDHHRRVGRDGDPGNTVQLVRAFQTVSRRCRGPIQLHVRRTGLGDVQYGRQLPPVTLSAYSPPAPGVTSLTVTTNTWFAAMLSEYTRRLPRLPCWDHSRPDNWRKDSPDRSCPGKRR